MVKTIRLLAIVHDLDMEPSWSSEWVAQALNNIIKVCQEQGISSIQLPVLGAKHGQINIEEFLRLLVIAIKKTQGKLKKIWLVVPRKDCSSTLSFLKKLTIDIY